MRRIFLFVALVFSGTISAQTVYFSYSDGNLAEEQLSDSKESVSVDLTPDCNNNEVILKLSGIDSVYYNNSKGIISQSFSPSTGRGIKISTFKNGCSSDQFIWLDPVVPTGTSIVGATEIYILDSTYTYLAFGGSRSAFSWSFENDSILITDGNRAEVVWEYNFDEAQIKLVETSMYGCEGQEVIKSVFDYLSIPDVHSSSFSLFPNPTKNKLNLAFDQIDLYEFRIFDITGGEVKSGELQGTTIDVSQLGAGAYFLTISSSQNTFISKFNKL